MNKSKPYVPQRSNMDDDLRTTRDHFQVKKILHRKTSSARITPQWTTDDQNANKLIKEFEQEAKRKRIAAQRARMPVSSKPHKLLSYEERKMAAEERKEYLERQRYEQTFRKKRATHRTIALGGSVNDEDVLVSVNYLFSKLFVVKLLTAPLSLAKSIKQKQKIA
jgi:hypothetical protein